MPNQVKEFNVFREHMNDKILCDKNKVIKRIFNLDTIAYKAGALDMKSKELLGFVTSTVMHCDDCIKYHLENCHKENLTKSEVIEALSITTLVGGTIVIPYLHRAYE